MSNTSLRLFRIRSLLLCALFTAASPLAADETYIVIAASATSPDAEQPTHIGLRRWGGPLRRIDADIVIRQFPGGMHYIEHIDFGYSVHSNKDRIFGIGASWVEVHAGKINVLGHILVEEIAHNKWKLGLADNRALLEAACRKMPDVFETHEVVMAETGEVLSYSCE